MTLQTAPAPRVFRYSGIDLADPDLSMTPESVRDFYTHVYPEIASAGIEGPEQEDGKLVYEFRRAVGTKGAAQRPATIDEHIEALKTPRLTRNAIDPRVFTPANAAAFAAVRAMTARTADPAGVAPSAALPLLP